MERAIIFPKGKKNTVAELAIFTLGKKWPLRLREVHEEIIKRGGRVVSIQATHKSLKKLAGQGIIVKQNSKYALDKKWLGKIAEFSEKTGRKYNNTIK